MAIITSGVSAGEVLQLITSGSARTRTAIAHRTGLSRSTVSERLDALFDAELITEGAEARPARGRPSKILSLNLDGRLVLAADVGEDHTRVAITDLSGGVLSERVGEFLVTEGATPTIDWIVRAGLAMLDELARRPEEILGVALSLPAPVDFDRGQVVGPSIMTGWEGVALEPLVQRAIEAPVVVENDVNARGLGEYLANWSAYSDVLYIKAGTGIGSAIISGGEVFRGSSGAAGDIGHIRLEPETGPLCRCGALGCVEAYAAGWSVVRDLSAQGFEVADTRAAMALVSAGAPEAIHLVRRAGQALGRAIAYSVSLLNPRLVIVSGSLAQNNEHLLNGIRHSVYQYSLPLATRDLEIVAGRSEPHHGISGVAHLAVDRALSPDRINSYLRSRLP